MPVPPLTVNEIIAVLKRSSLSNVLVEGSTDASIYRWLENKIGILNVNIIPCGGRKALLEIYDRRKEYSNAKVVFLADKDMWLFSGIPTEYHSIIWTEGYSIENDLFSSSFSIISTLFDEDEREVLDKLIKSVSQWFAFEVERYRESMIYPTFHSIQRVADKDYGLCDNFKVYVQYVEPQKSTFNEIYTQYILKLRGKTLLSIIAHILSAPQRKSKYSNDNIIELALKTNQVSMPLARIVEAIKYQLGNYHLLKQAAVSVDNN